MTEKLRIEITAIRRRITITRDAQTLSNTGEPAVPNEIDPLGSVLADISGKLPAIEVEATRKSHQHEERTTKK